ncbi:TonB-dependent receptor [Acinetobacter larvae]|uniref:TonB-dependent receptor n=2 Tax=Acinetobacter larvae TaxID=1789224 RepID=A0A1B2M4D0_9GAMM|nr:TonB-dependent receptor [Acinetobacter larvae]
MIFTAMMLGSSPILFAQQQDVSVLPVIEMQAQQQEKALKNGNMDIIRTENDIQPYTIIKAEDIKNTGATNVSDLITKLLPQATSIPNDSGSGFTGTTSQINLRGLGANHTLILINGRRAAGMGSRGTAESTDQPNLNNIPLEAIERIEVLPTSASAIYGSGAIGGVINVILKRDYVGTDVTVRYENTLGNDQPVKTVNLVTGFALEEGRTQVLFTASKRDQDPLSQFDKKWRNMGRNLQLQNNPNSIHNASSPPAGDLVNLRIKNSDGSYTAAHIPKGWDGDINKLGEGYALGLSDQMSAWSGNTTLITESKTEAYSLSINRDFTDKLNVYLEGSYDKEEGKHLTTPHGYGVVTYKADNPTNPFGKEVQVNFPVNWSDMGEKAYRRIENETKRVATGFSFDLTPDFTVSADYAWSQADIMVNYPRRGSNNPGAKAWTADLNAGLIELIKDTTTESTDIIAKYWNYPKTQTQSTLNDFALRGAGSIYTWYAGDISMATGLEYRKTKTEGFADHQHVDNPWRKPTERNMEAKSAYLEFGIPLISPDMQIPWAKLFDVQIAGRYEEFNIDSSTPQYKVDSSTGYNSVLTGYTTQPKTKFDAITPTIGFRFAPNEQILLRASYSEGFIAPTVSQLAEASSSQTTSTTLVDPKTGKIISSYDAISGGNPDITPESSKSYNAGIVLTPDFIPDLRLSLDYFHIEKTNNITEPSAEYILANEGNFPGRVTRDEQGNVTAINTQPFNALGLKTSGFDTAIHYSFDSILGSSNFNLGYTYVDQYIRQTNLNGGWESQLDGSASGNPIRHRANATFTLKPNETWTFGWGTQYYSAYHISNAAAILNQTGQTADSLKIGGEFFHDIFARAKFKVPGVKQLNHAELGFGINNLFDTYTLDMSGTNYISRYSNVLGRNYYLNLKLSF